jgi:hypothetical protein
MLSIDFGNTYTKVALRAGPDSPGSALQDSSLKWDELNICVPTLAASYEKGGKTEWYYSTELMKFKESTPGLTVFRNWKPRFFDGTGRRLPARAPAPAAVGGPAPLPTPPGLTDKAWATMRANLPPDVLGTLWTELGGRLDPVPDAGPVEETGPEHKMIGLGFFHWLREFYDPICRKKIGRPASEIPARVSLPSFGSMHKAELLLSEILSEAGWMLDERSPTLPEPLSNAIGTFTEGVNATHRSHDAPHYGEMFRHTGMLARMREAILRGGPKTAWVLIVDVGGYTADFAMVGLDLEDVDARIEGHVDGKPRLAHHSEPLGVTDLDARVGALLPEAKRKALDEVIADPDQQRLEGFHKGCYGYLGRANLRRHLIGGTPKEKDAIRDVVREFASEVADEAEKFLDMHQYQQIDDLILTGGGTMIRSVQEALCKRLSHYGVRKVHLHWTDDEKPISSIPIHPLPYVLVRGATAVGGASVYFDFAGDRE